MFFQSHLCRCMETIDGKARFTVDRWMRKNVTLVLRNLILHWNYSPNAYVIACVF